jgi:hypothetical protein
MRTYPFLIAITIMLIVQIQKGVVAWVRQGRPDFRRFVRTGGMPSAHAASVSALTTSVAFTHGVRSALFSVALYFSLVVMYDATGLRRSTGQQAALLNRLLETHANRQLLEHRLWELVGHTPFEVVVGAVVGVFYALVWYRL